MHQERKTRESKSLQGQTGNHRFAVLVRKCLHSHVVFFFFFFVVPPQIRRWYLACYGKNVVIVAKFTKFLEMFKRERLQCLQGTTSYRGTTKLWGEIEIDNKFKEKGAGRFY